MKLIFTILSAALLLLCSFAVAQQRGHVQGRIVDEVTKQPMIGANVAVIGTGFGAAADSDGIYRIENLPEDVYILQISYIGYEDYLETDVLVVRGKTTHVSEIELFAMPLQVEAATVTDEVAATTASRQSFQREEIRRNPGTSGDVLRAVGSLPGVSTSEGEFSAMSVRGGGVYDNLILIDNIPFEKINHFEGGSSEQETQGGRFSVFTGGLVERATFYGGGFGAEYGRKGAAVLDLKVKEGNRESPTITGSYDLLGPEVNYDGPTYLFKNTSLMVNYRNFDLRSALEMIDQEDFGDPTMSDLIAKTTTWFNANHQVSLLGLYSTDRLLRGPRNIMKGEDLVENDLWDIDESRWLFGANWRWLTSSNSVLHNTLYVRGNDRYRSFGRAWADEFGGALPPSLAQLNSRSNIGIQNQDEIESGWKADFHYATGSEGTLNLGVETYRIDLDYNYTQNGLDTLFEFTANDLFANGGQKFQVIDPVEANYRFDGAATNFSAYANYDCSKGRFLIRPGIRYSYSGFGDHHMLAPRLRVGYQLTGKTTLNLASGIYYQKPLNRVIATIDANRNLQDERAVHAIFGFNHELGNNYRLTVEGYYKWLSNMIVPAASTLNRFSNDGDGWTSGLDAILLKRFTKKYYGQISYSFAMSKRNDHDGMGEYNAPYQQPHNFAVILGYQLNKQWFFAGRWKYAVGRPKDDFVVHEVITDSDAVRYSREILQRNGARIPDFHVLSVRVDYRKQFGRLALITFFDLDNLYNRQNVYEDRFSELTGKEKGLGIGFVGNGGFKLEF